MRATRLVLIRDFVIFLIKLVLDALKDGFLFHAAIVAVVLDLFFSGRRRRIFYAVMKLGERFDLWLNLHGALSAEDTGNADGLFGASKAGSDNLLGKLEQAVRGGDEPRGASRRKKNLKTPRS